MCVRGIVIGVGAGCNVEIVAHLKERRVCVLAGVEGVSIARGGRRLLLL